MSIAILDEAMMPDAVEDFTDYARIHGSVVIIVNGDVSISGKFRSLKINGYTVRVPRYVLDQSHSKKGGK